MEEDAIISQPKTNKQIIPTAGKSRDEMRIFLFEFFGMALFAYGYKLL